MSQVSNPKARFAIWLSNDRHIVQLLPSGWLEFDGKVLTLAEEKATDAAIAKRGAYLQEIVA
jgi:hypothetical protein